MPEGGEGYLGALNALALPGMVYMYIYVFRSHDFDSTPRVAKTPRDHECNRFLG